MKSNLAERYYLWLCDLAGVDQVRKTYWQLSTALHCKEFRWSVPNDDNRAFEGRNLREQFCDELDIDYEYDAFPEQATMFELIISLAYRCESIMADQPVERNMKDWFWKIMSNVGLHRFTDDAWETGNVDHVVDAILDKIIDRTYHRDGVGGLFPLKRDKKDQRKVELWYQLNAYLVENYYTNEDVM